MPRFQVPKQLINTIVDRYHVSATDDAIRADIRGRAARMNARLAQTGARLTTDKQLQRMESYAVQRHENNRALYARVMSGRI